MLRSGFAVFGVPYGVPCVQRGPGNRLSVSPGVPSRPDTPDGRVKIDKDKARAREEAQVRLLMAGDPIAVIVLLDSTT